MTFYYLPTEYESDQHGALGVCIGSLLSMIRAPGAGPTDLFTARNVFERVFKGTGQGGESITLWELTRWKNRESTEAGLLPGAYDDDDFLAWNGEDSPFRPQWRVYGNAEFKNIFVTACRNFTEEHPANRKEVESALASMGLSLKEAGDMKDGNGDGDGDGDGDKS